MVLLARICLLALALLGAIGLPLLQFLHEGEHCARDAQVRALAARAHQAFSFNAADDEAHCPICQALSASHAQAVGPVAIHLAETSTRDPAPMAPVLVAPHRQARRWHPQERGPPRLRV